MDVVGADRVSPSSRNGTSAEQLPLSSTAVFGGGSVRRPGGSARTHRR
ncbi:hypothetical protein MINT15_33960 [Saccharomonospora viridis]|uniref:Uncharacterized protein n=1 Tax=Saccharomonospora viridis TaxID=1852 RepID=A0A837D9X1_9PSEU|nr:hypothetical protein MINT15_33960 [Saccharomonospora viridis]